MQNLEIGAAYVRVSTDDQTELSPDAQVRVIMDAAKADGYLIPEEFTFIEKKGISGRKANNRPEFQRMIALAKSQDPSPFKRLYLWKFSRFARNQEESVFYKSILRKKCGVDIKSVSEPIMDGMFGRLIESIIEWFDEYYSINLSGEVLRGMTEKALRNGYQSVPPLGYQAVGEGKPFAIDPERIGMAEFIFTAYHDGTDMTAIAREMNRRGWQTKRGNPFERRTVARILSNRFYIGEVTWNGITFQGTHPIQKSIMDVFDKNQQRISKETHFIHKRQVSSCKHWLSGMLTCYICGATLSVTRSNDPKKRPDYFQCWKYAKGFHTGSCSISVKKAERSVLESLQRVLDTGEVDFEYIPKVNKMVVSECALLEAALSKTAIKEQRVREAYENGVDSLDEYKSNKARLLAEREHLQQELRKLNAQEPDIPPALQKEQLMVNIRSVYNLIQDSDIDYETKGNSLRSIVKSITFNRETDMLNFHYFI
ncbi:MAG: recombinase family protein [Lachnospiraceae bacterium]|jgi:site-specific DNA recombinase|nr:recombinase family protein [Lachnospiraceae bacterium]